MISTDRSLAWWVRSKIAETLRDALTGCPCGCSGSWDRFIAGTFRDQPAVWSGCKNRDSTVGKCLSGPDYFAAQAFLDECEARGVSPDDVLASRVERFHGQSHSFDAVVGPVALEAEREAAAWMLEESSLTETIVRERRCHEERGFRFVSCSICGELELLAMGQGAAIDDEPLCEKCYADLETLY